MVDRRSTIDDRSLSLLTLLASWRPSLARDDCFTSVCFLICMYATCTYRQAAERRYFTVYRGDGTVYVPSSARELPSMGRRSLRALTLYLTSQYLTLARIAKTPNTPRPSKGALPCCPFMLGFRRREGGRAGLCVGWGWGWGGSLGAPRLAWPTVSLLCSR